MRVELGFDNSLCLVDIERLELGIAGFTDADYGNVLRRDPEITFWHEHRLSGSIVGGNPKWLPTSAASAAFSAFPAFVGALWPATRLIDIQLAAVELSTIQFGDRLVRISRAGHLHEGRPARLARITVGHDTYAIDRTISCRQLAQIVFTGPVVEVPNEDVLHVDALS
jgi:hypothetical protein